MRSLALLVPFALLLAACGGGSTGGPVDDGVIRIDSNEVAPLDPDYRAVFDATARIRISGIPLPVTLTGTYVLENEGETVVYPGDESRTGWKVRSTLTIDVPAALRLQNPELPSEIEIVAREFIQVQEDGAWMSLGGELVDPTQEPPVTLRSWWASPMQLLEPVMEPDQVIDVPLTDVLDEQFVETIGMRATSRVTQSDTEVVSTALGDLECYVTEVAETLRSAEPGALPIPIGYMRWERPDLGLVRLVGEGLSYEGIIEDQPVRIDVDRLEALLRSLEP